MKLGNVLAADAKMLESPRASRRGRIEAADTYDDIAYDGGRLHAQAGVAELKPSLFGVSMWYIHVSTRKQAWPN